MLAPPQAPICTLTYLYLHIPCGTAYYPIAAIRPFLGLEEISH